MSNSDEILVLFILDLYFILKANSKRKFFNKFFKKNHKSMMTNICNKKAYFLFIAI